MSKRPREEEEEPTPRKKPKLHTNAAIGAVLELVFDGTRLPHLPTELRDLIIDLTAPSPLRQFADDPTAPFFDPPDVAAFCSPLYEAALEQLFASLATGWSETYHCRVMVRRDFLAMRRANGSTSTEEQNSHDWCHEILNQYGLPDRIERTELSLEGFFEAHTHPELLFSAGASQMRVALVSLANHLEPTLHYKV